jgi:exo-1,4-beta-D-glucosaminidase
MAKAFFEDWLVQSSERVSTGGRELSAAGPGAHAWYRATLPATVLGVLVENGVYADPFRGLGWNELPGRDPAHENFSNHPMPDDSPFLVPWWFYKEFELEREAEQVWLQFEGINYRANVWLNGTLVADSKTIAGAYREHELLISESLVRGGTNRLALEVFPPAPDDLAITWVDWNPSPPDKNTGLFRPARLVRSGPVALRDVQVRARFPGPYAELAELELHATLKNATDEMRRGVLTIELETGTFQVEFELGPRERLAFDAREIEALRLPGPRLWWPRRMGEQPLYRLKLEVLLEGKRSDADSLAFGVREVTSELTDRGHSLFRVNKRPILIRGGGWASDLFLRSNPERTLFEYEYVKDLGLNAIRFEGMLEGHEFLARCDRDGMLVIAGFCCCDHWEKWQDWKAEDLEIAVESLRSQIRRARNHPCLVAWWYGSDNPPPRHVEERYLEVLEQERWPNPAHSSAADKATERSGPSGLKMAGPYDYVPPSYWLSNTTRGGAFGFATEVSPGAAIPVRESLEQMLTERHLWPPDECWTLHAGGGPFKDLSIFDGALAARYGPPTDLDDYVWKAQLASYEGERAMFEAFAREKYRATGVIQWMLNNAWPSLIWHLWDWYLRPGGGYFGAKKACEPVHVQYSYDDRSVVVVSELPERLAGLEVEARLLNLDASELWRGRAEVSLAPDSAARCLFVPTPAGLGVTHLLRLDLRDAAKKLVSTNLYWLSTAEDRTEDRENPWYTSPLVAHADLTGLSALKPARVSARCRLDEAAGEVAITLATAGELAFFTRLRLLSGSDGAEVLPVWWEDNFVTLLPFEERTILARFPLTLDAAPLLLELSSLNARRKLVTISK